MYIHSVIQVYNLYTHNVLRGAQGWTRSCATLVGGTRGGPKPCVQETQIHSVSITNSHQS